MKTIRLDGVVGWDILAADIAAQIEGQSEVRLVMNSGGGDIIEGFSIINLFKDFPGKLHASIDFAGSMMSAIAMFCDTRAMYDNSSILMTHRPLGGTFGRSEDLRSHADTLDLMEKMVTTYYASVSGMSESEAAEFLSTERYMDAEEALSVGLIDRIETGKADLSAVAMAVMKAQARCGNFNCSMLVDKIELMKSHKSPVRDIFAGASSLASVEAVMRQEFNLSRSEATAIVAAVRKIDHGDRDHKEVLNVISNFQFKNF